MRPGHLIPLDILNAAAPVANEMMMPQALGVESRGAAFDGHFTHQSRLDQIPKIVVSCGSGRARIDTIDRFEDLRGGGMPCMLH